MSHTLTAWLIGLAFLCSNQSVLAADLAVATAQAQTIQQERVFDAVIEAVHQSTVSAQIVGRVVEINYDVDDFVPKGSVILRFRDSEQRARLEQAQASLQETQARLKEAQDEYSRVKDIYAKKLVAKAELDKAEAGLKAARARVEAAAARLAEGQEQLDHTVIKAPFAGVVTQRHVELGETVGVGQPLMTGFSFEHLRATTQIPQAFVTAVREHGEARISLPDGKRVAAESLRVFPFADEQSHAFNVRVNLPQGDHGVYPGMFVKVAFVTGDAERVLIPAVAVVKRSELTGVYVVDAAGTVSLRQLRIGARHDEQVDVLAGLEVGEQVALDPIAAGIALKQQQR
ncbi:RND transporter [Candidatus Tenderia electrophaga]|uniref:RND transporter n=1 Tax=Candidatus Tenderia electrophaga TaxID=1748243 RepID=A0A0S2TCI9_9GAMM|nr:RND transporter [Candidatus Tenderia electrophaga]